MYKVSVIVPIYNCEKYLNRCIDSIISQTYKNLDVILVDDGSTDNSNVICDQYASIDSRISVIHKINGGLSSARNAGIDKAKGDLICFVDSDDWISEDIIEHCVELMIKSNCDVVDYQCYYTNEYKVISQNAIKTEILEGKEILRDYLYVGQFGIAPFSMCRKLYKLSLFDGIRCPIGRINEDIATNYKILLKCDKIVKTNKIGYYYFQEGSSITRGGFKSRDLDLLVACQELLELTENDTYKDINKLAKIKYERSNFSILAKIAVYGISDPNINKKETIKKLLARLRKNYFFLIKSKMPLSRKVIMTLMCINYYMFEKMIKIIRKVKK